MALSFADVQQRLPAGVHLEKSITQSQLTVDLRGRVPALVFGFGGLGFAVYFGVTSPVFGVQVALGIALLASYFVAAYALDRRRVTIDGEAMRVRSLPLPLPGDGKTLIDDVNAVQVIVITGVRAGRIGYRIDVVRRGKSKAIVTDLVDEEQALVLARYLATELRVPLPEKAQQVW